MEQTSNSISEREKQLAKREGFVDACQYIGWGAGEADAAAKWTRAAERKYPLPQVRRPLRGTFSDGTVAWWDAESHFVRRASFPYDCMLSFFASAYVRSDDDHTLLGRMLSGECESVDDDGGDHE